MQPVHAEDPTVAVALTLAERFRCPYCGALAYECEHAPDAGEAAKLLVERAGPEPFATWIRVPSNPEPLPCGHRDGVRYVHPYEELTQVLLCVTCDLNGRYPALDWYPRDF